MSTADTRPCPVCGERIKTAARKCRHCGEEFDQVETPETEGDSTGGLIPYKNPSALTAYYLGLFSLLPCFPLGLAALFLGIKGLLAVKKNPAIRGTVHAWIGILMGGFFGLLWTIGTMGVVVAAVLGGNRR